MIGSDEELDGRLAALVAGERPAGDELRGQIRGSLTLLAVADAPAPGSVAEIRDRAFHSRLIRRIAAAAAAVLLLVGFAFTPPGSAIADAVGELVGIGDEPSRTADGEPPAEVAFPAGSHQAVIATGIASNSQPYEMIVTAGRNDIPLEHPNDVGMCVDVDLPAVSAGVGEDYQPFACINDTARRAIADGNLQPHVVPATADLGPETMFLATGWLPLDIASAKVSYTDAEGKVKEAPVAYGRIEGDLATEIGAPDQYAFYAAFIPSDALEQDPAGSDTELSRCEADHMLRGISAQFFDSGGNLVDDAHPDAEDSVQLVAMQPEGFKRSQGAKQQLSPFELEGCEGMP